MLQDADLHDLIEAFARITLTNGTPLIDKETRALLAYTRTVRNSSAHPGKQQRRTARQLVEVIGNSAQYLWTTTNRARLTKAPIIKTW